MSKEKKLSNYNYIIQSELFFPEHYKALVLTVQEWEEMKADLPRNWDLFL